MFKNMKKSKLLISTAVFAALVASVALAVHIPIGNGYMHFGDALIYLAACLLPFPYATAAAAVGGAFADFATGYAVYIIPTIAIKAILTFPFSSKSDKILTKRNILMLLPAGAITIGGYFLAELFYFGLAGAVAELPGNGLQVAASYVIFLSLGAALDKIKFKDEFIHH
jgi:uncharacterized repeat protein (TIGR04002 family)